MGIFLDLSSFALEPLVSGACRVIGWEGGREALKAAAGSDAMTTLVRFLYRHFADSGQRLTNALQRANARAWTSLEMALAGPSWWERCKRLLSSAAEKEFGRQVHEFLASVPQEELSARGPEFRQQCLRELRAAARAGVLAGDSLEPERLAQCTAALACSPEADGDLEALWQGLGRLAGRLTEAGYPALAEFVALRPAHGDSLLVIAVRYFFRREIESDRELFQGLAWGRLECLRQAQEAGFAALDRALTDHGDRVRQWLDEIQAVVVETHDVVLDIRGELRGQREQVRDLGEAVLRLLEQHRLQGRELCPSDSLSLHDEDERRLVKALVGRYRELPEGQRQQLPALLNALGKLQVVAGEFDSAQRDFQAVAGLVSDSRARAEAHHNAYRAALERRDWPAALREVLRASELDPARFAPFPLEKFQPERILGAGGFGVAYLCRNRNSGSPVVIKAIWGDGLGRRVSDVFREARALEQLEHPSIIRLRDFDYAGPGRTRPYLVMDYFDGLTLEDHVKQHGRLTPPELVELACGVADGLKAAHGARILHRDVKPANLLVRREGGPGWRVKLIDFGLAVSPRAVASTVHGPTAQRNTVAGSSVAGTVEFAAPEQMGKLPGVSVGPYSDVYGFGKTCCYALFQTAQPLPRHWQSVPASLAHLLGSCLEESPEGRPANFVKVLDRLRQVGEEMRRPVAIPVAVAAGADEKTEAGRAGAEGRRAAPKPRTRTEKSLGRRLIEFGVGIVGSVLLVLGLKLALGIDLSGKSRQETSESSTPADREAEEKAVEARTAAVKAADLAAATKAAAVKDLPGKLAAAKGPGQLSTTPVGTWESWVGADVWAKPGTLNLDLQADKSFTVTTPMGRWVGTYEYDNVHQELTLDYGNGEAEHYRVESLTETRLDLTHMKGKVRLAGERLTCTRAGKGK